MQFTDKELLNITEEVSSYGYKRLQKIGTYKFSAPYYDLNDYKNDLFLWLKKTKVITNFNNTKSQLKTYIINYVIKHLNRYLIANSEIYNKKYVNSSDDIKFQSLDKTEIVKHNSNKYIKERFYKQSLLNVLNSYVKNSNTCNPVEVKSIKKVLSIVNLDEDDTEHRKTSGYFGSIIDTNCKQKIRRFLKKAYDISKISDIPVSLIKEF